jgi:hypothetical protein
MSDHPLQVDPHRPENLVLMSDGHEVGRLTLSKGKLEFSGDLHFSAFALFHAVSCMWRQATVRHANAVVEECIQLLLTLPVDRFVISRAHRLLRGLDVTKIEFPDLDSKGDRYRSSSGD